MAHPLESSATPGTRPRRGSPGASQPRHTPVQPDRPDLVVRQRLLALMDLGAAGPLTVLSAPAGYGKSVLATSWVRRLPSTAVASLVVTEGCQGPAGFWPAALDSLRSAGLDVEGLEVNGLDRERLNLASGVGDAGVGAVAALGEWLARRPEPVVWVVDCDEFSLHADVADGLHRLLRASAGRLHLVLLTRSDPLLPLHRYRLQDQLTEVRAADLAFTVSEVSALMARSGVEIAPPDVAALHARTAGWPAGLRFAAMGLAGRRDADRVIHDFRGDTGNVGAYLMSEVLAKQTPEMREFLLRTSVADVLDPGVVGALTGQHCDARSLQFVANGNSFIVPLPGGGGRYRYQPLFREFLRSELAYRQPGLVPELHRSAAAWLAAQGQYLSAVSHAVAAGSWEDAAYHFVDGLGVAALLVGRQRPALHRLLAQVPLEQPGPAASLTRAAVALADDHPQECLAELASMRSALAEDPVPLSAGCALAAVVLDAEARAMGPDVDAALDSVMAAESAVHTFPSGSHHRRETLALVSATKGRVLLEHGDSDAARVALEVAIEAASESGLDAFGLELRGLAALAHVSDGHLRRAVQLVGGQPSDRVGAPGVPISSRAAALALAWVRVDEDDLDAAARLLDMVPQLASGSEGRLLQAVHAIVRASLLQASGHADLAGASVRAVRPGPVGERGTGWLDHALVVSESDSLLASGRPHEALALLETLGPCAHPGCALQAERARLEEARLDGAGPLPSPPMPLRSAQSLRTEVDSLLVAATRQLHDGDRDRAEHSLEAALQLAAPEHLRRPFLEAPPPVRALLDDTGRSTRLLHPTADKQARHRPEVPLTAREQEVLVHLAELLTTEEIGRAMFVSVNTVRSHVRSVLRKLDVTRRNEAVRRAWELGLLPQRPEL